jgi:hypothetical protein
MRGGEIKNVAKLYHRDGTTCVNDWSCLHEPHTSIPPVCGAESAAEGANMVCELPGGHPGPHLHVATGREF